MVSVTGRALLIVLWVVIAVALFWLTVTNVGWLLGVVAIGLVFYVLWIGGVNINNYLKTLSR